MLSLSPQRPVASTSSAKLSLQHSHPRELEASRPGNLVDLGAQVALTGSDFVSGLREARYEKWVLRRETLYQSEDPQGTPAAWLNGSQIDSRRTDFASNSIESTNDLEMRRHSNRPEGGA